MTRLPHRTCAVVTLLALSLTACGSGSEDSGLESGSDTEPSSGDELVSDDDVSIGDDGDATLDLGDDGVDESDQAGIDPCDVIDPVAFSALVPEMTPFAFNEVLTYGAGSCAYIGPRDATWVIYVRSADGSSPTDFLAEKVGTFEGWETRPVDGGAAIHEIEGGGIEAMAIDGGGSLALLVAPSTGNVMTDDGWASTNEYLADQLAALS